MSAFVRDTDGNTWEPFINEFQQHQLRCIEGPRLGQIIHDPRLRPYAGRSVSTRDPVRPEPDPWIEGLYRSEFPGLMED